jgi:lipopolysaccharide biosynthesis glycosyltransferase
MIRIFIGTEPAQWLPTEVLKHSITRHSQAEYEFKELKNIPLKLQVKMYTGFSFYRFSIPETCNFEGRAIYLDADIVALGDLKELNEMDMGDHGVLARPHKNKGYFTSVMLMDCAKLKNWKVHQWVTLINAGITSYDMIMGAMPTSLNHKDFGPLDPIWNDLDHFDEKTKVIHYTHVPSQPWKVPGHPYAKAYLHEMKVALEDKIISPEDVQKEIDAGHIYPTILQDALAS